MEGPEIKFAEAVLDNGKYGTRTVRFETGRLAQQAQGAVAAYLDEETMLPYPILRKMFETFGIPNM